LRLKSQAAYHP